jgi:hypothetical protein
MNFLNTDARWTEHFVEVSDPHKEGHHVRFYFEPQRTHMKYEDIKMFSERCEKHPDHQSGMITNSMIQQRLHEEIDELREYIEQALKEKNNGNS